MERRKAKFLVDKRTFLSKVLSPVNFVIIFFLLQLGLIVFTWIRFYDLLDRIFVIISIINVIMIVRIFSDKQSIPEFKLTWATIVLAMPLLGTLLYFFTDYDIGHYRLKKELIKVIDDSKGIISQDSNTEEDLKKHPDLYQLQKYISTSGDFDFSNHTDAKYLPTGEAFFADLLDELSQAEHFIFMEYFIIQEGEMWGEILNILEEKVKAGVEVRIIYDGLCDLVKLPYNYYRKLREIGIKCNKYLAYLPFISTVSNFRDHRKITVIDNKVAYFSGANLADEYINVVHPFGYWKDSAIKMSGEAVRNVTLMFLQMYNIAAQNKDYEKFISINSDIKYPKAEGFVLPFCDYPLDEYQTSERAYISLINEAKNYIYIKTPYMVLDGEMQRAIEFAALRGVDVRILFPGIPDKKLVYALGKTYYHSLVSAGVKIYEYTPGFMHSKEILIDDIKGIVGTVNLDYRSFYHHFECACFLYDMNCLNDIKKDFNECFEVSHLVDEKDISSMKLSTRIIGTLMSLISTMM